MTNWYQSLRFTSLIYIELLSSRALWIGAKVFMSYLQRARGYLENFICCWFLLCDVVNGPSISGNLTSLVLADMAYGGRTLGQGTTAPSVPNRENPPKPVEQRPNTTAGGTNSPNCLSGHTRGAGSHWTIHRNTRSFTARHNTNPNSSNSGTKSVCYSRGFSIAWGICNFSWSAGLGLFSKINSIKIFRSHIRGCTEVYCSMYREPTGIKTTRVLGIEFIAY